MKKFIYFIFSFCLLFSACSKNEVEFKDYQTIQNEKFTSDFISEFGQPAADQDWGFDDIQIYDYTKMTAGTRGHDVNRNQWADKYDVPANVTEAEEQAVLNKLAQSSGNRDAKPTVDWSNYFVYQVHRGTDAYNDHNNSDIGVASSYMNHLQAVSSNGSMEHINDFNSGDQKSTWQSIEGATLMINSTTYNFAYHNSRDNKYHDCYTVIDGATIGYPGFYYICFDFLANGDIEQPANKNMGVDRTYNYTDWIVRICPATPNMNGATRIIAEDLGDSSGSDFDYNDVVFDVKLVNESVDGQGNKLVAYMVLQAAGGTLPLVVGDQEVHNLFGVSTKTMVNTRKNTVSKSPVSFKYIIGDADWNITGSAAVRLIPVMVQNGSNVYSLAVETGKAPEKIAVKTTFIWCDERQPIKSRYPLFSDWVLNKSVNWF